MEMVRQYFKDMEDWDAFETPEGFCFYKAEGPELFMAHFYAKKGKSFEFFKKVVELGNTLGSEYISGNIYLNDHNSDCVSKRLKIFLGLGAKIVEANNQRITILKLL